MARKRYVTWGFHTALLALALDQISKWVLLEKMGMEAMGSISVLPFFDLVMVWNRGVSFGMFAAQNQPYFLIGLSLVIIFILIRWLAKTDSRWVAVSLGLTIGGALGNVIDRLRFGAVADFFDFHIENAHWPAFNVADSAIFIGVVLLCAHSMFMDHSK